LRHTRSKEIPILFFHYDNQTAYRLSKFARKEGRVLVRVGLRSNSLIGDSLLLLLPSHTPDSGRTPCAKSLSQISIRISLLMLLSPFLHYPRSDCQAVVINLRSDEAGKREQRERERERSD
jgi:hypothetical protein